MLVLYRQPLFLGMQKGYFSDFMHHIVFAICGLGSMSLAWSWGPGANFAFFLTGFPGGVDYFMLAMVKLKIMNRITEKKLNTPINTYMVQEVLVVISAAWTYSNYVQGIMEPPVFIVILQMILLFVNGQYYATRIALNYQKL